MSCAVSCSTDSGVRNPATVLTLVAAGATGGAGRVEGLGSATDSGWAGGVQGGERGAQESQSHGALPPQDAFACSSSRFRASTTRWAASGGTSWYTWNFHRYVPRPWVSECSTVAYLSSSASGTSARTLVSRPSFSVPRMWPRRDDRSPITAPWYSSGVHTSSSRMGSSRAGRAFGLTFRKARIPAILNDCSFESTSWYEPSYSSTLKSTTG